MADKLKTFNIGERTYSLLPMSPDEAMSFGFKVVSAVVPMLGGLGKIKEGQLNGVAEKDRFLALLGAAAQGFDSDRVESLCREAVKYLVAPGNIELSDPVGFNKYFMQHPEDLLAAPLRAVWELSRDFLPKWMLTAAQKLSVKTAELASSSQTDIPKQQ